MPPPPSTSDQPPGPGPFKKFILHPATLISPSSSLNLTANGTGPLSNAAIAGLRVQLQDAKRVALERNAIKDVNKKNLVERQSLAARLAEDMARTKEAERKKKREDDEKREREKVERLERDRLEREREEQREKIKEEEEYQLKRAREEQVKRLNDERERERAVREAREVKEKLKVVEVLKIVRANEATRDEDQHPKKDEVMEDVKPSFSLLDSTTTSTPPLPAPTPTLESVKIKEELLAGATPSPNLPLKQPPLPPSLPPSSLPPPTPSTYIEPSSSLPLPAEPLQTPSITIISSPELEAEDEFGQPKLPRPKSSIDKKRKHDQVIQSDDSDDNEDQPLSQKIRKLDDKLPSSIGNGAGGTQISRTNSQTPAPTPAPTPTPTTIEIIIAERPKDPNEGLSLFRRKLKEEKFIKHSIPTRPPAPGTAQAFYLPSNTLAPQQPISVAPIATAKKQSEVSDDFSKAKPGTQITHNAFHAWAEAYLRPFGEDDLAFLAPKPDDLTLYTIPPLGKHYLEKWEEEDSDLPIASTSSYQSPLEPPRLPRYRPDALTEDALGMENVFLGPLSERLVAAMAFEEEGDVEDGELEENVERGENAGLLMLGRGNMDAVELEERIKSELKFIGILGEEEVDWASRQDDEVSASLRACQRLLQRQTILNEARKSVLSSIVKDRMAYQDYETTRDAQERVIESGWTKRQRAGKKKGKGKERDKPTDGPKPPVSLSLLSAVEKRHKLVSLFRPFFEDEEDKGRFWGIPETSVYEGMVVEGLEDDDDGFRLE